MGSLWYVYEGSPSTIGDDPRCHLTFAKLKLLFGKYELKYIGTDPPKFPSSNPVLDGYRPLRYIVFELPDDELIDVDLNRIGFQPEIRHGFYRLDIGIEQCEAILKKEQL